MAKVNKTEVNGKVEGAPRSINEVLGFRDSSYKTHDVEEYEKQLFAMNLSDLQRHALEVHLKPNSERRLLIAKLVKEFKRKNSSFIGPHQSERAAASNRMTKEDRRKALKVMEGAK